MNHSRGLYGPFLDSVPVVKPAQWVKSPLIFDLYLKRSRGFLVAHLTIVRGLPGSGKSTYAKTLKQPHFEADMFFENENGEYIFQSHKVPDAHKWCQNQVFDSLNAGKDTVVSNTFCKFWEVKPYVKFCERFNHTFSFVICEGNYGSIHNVPSETYEKMMQNWQEF